MQIILIREGKVYEFATDADLLRQCCIWHTDKVREEAKGQPSASAPAKEEAKAEPSPAPIKQAESVKEGAKPVPNEFDLPKMKKAFFGGGQNKGDLKSFVYLVNGESPRKSPAATARAIFVKTEAFDKMDTKGQKYVLDWGLSFLKKQVRESGGKPASVTTKMKVAYTIDRYVLYAGSDVTFKVFYKPE